MDIRVGEIKECWKNPNSDNLWCEIIDIGEEGAMRKIGTKLQKYIPLEKMSGKVLVVANLKPRDLAGFPSHGMVITSSSNNKDQRKSKFELLRPPAEA